MLFHRSLRTCNITSSSSNFRRIGPFYKPAQRVSIVHKTYSTSPRQDLLLSPAVLYLINLHKISMSTASQIPASGPKKRLLKGDILSYVASGSTVIPIKEQTKKETIESVQNNSINNNNALRGKSGYNDLINSNMRRVIADRLTSSKTTCPHMYISCQCPIDNLLSVRSTLNDMEPETRISINDLVVKALALALRDVPEANSSWDISTSQPKTFDSVDVCVAVAVEGGLVTPVVSNADQKTVLQIAKEIRDFAERARAGTLAPEEYQGGSATVSNLGMYGISDFSAVLNPPQACILAVGGSEKRLVLNNKGRPEGSTVMNVTLSCDNRAVDEPTGAQLLDSFKHYLDTPTEMI